MEITILNKTRKKIKENNLKKFIKKLLEELKLKKDLSIMFCGDSYCKKINREFLKRNGLTDVISFPLNEKNYLGDVLINLKQVERQAKRMAITVNEELKRILIHGILHLAGYDHEKDNGEMEEFQEKLVLKFKL